MCSKNRRIPEILLAATNLIRSVALLTKTLWLLYSANMGLEINITPFLLLTCAVWNCPCLSHRISSAWHTHSCTCLKLAHTHTHTWAAASALLWSSRVNTSWSWEDFRFLCCCYKRNHHRQISNTSIQDNHTEY